MDVERIDEQLIRSGRMVAIGRLTPALIHEINNSLLVLLGIADLELSTLSPESKEYERLETVRDAGAEIRDAVSQLTGFTRAPLEGEQKLSLCDIAESVVSLVRRLKLPREVELTEHLCEEELLVRGNGALLSQALLHLLTNAFQSTPPGGAVTLEVERDGNDAVAVVTDSGPGVDQTQAEQLFEPFATTQPDRYSSGLGLAAARAIAHRHGGKLELCDSERGARFALRIPLAN
jgi:signal transduction histidine kinase